MKVKNIIIAAFLIICLQNCALAKTTMEKVQRGADIYFKITDRLELSLSQPLQAFGIKLEEAVHLVPLLNDIKVNEEKLNTLLADTKKDNEEEIKNLNNTIELQKAVASQKKRYYISRYRGILTQEQNYKLDELIFDIANGYLKL